MDKFTICVIYQANDDASRKSFLNELKEAGVIDLIRKEDGCLKYEYYFSVDDDCKIVLFEEWKNQDCQRVHMTQPHMKTAAEIKSKYIESVQLKEIKFV